MATDRPTRTVSPRGVVQVLEGLQQAGVTHLPKPKRRSPTAEIAAAPAPPPQPSAAPRQPSQQPVAQPALLDPFAGLIPAGDTLAAVRHDVAACRQCAELCDTRTQTVFGIGNEQPRLCFLGEAPGADEDAQGEPFVGRAGQLLTKIIEACRMQRGDVYILNVLKCRPPDNRTPTPEEAANCRPFLERQLRLLRPQFICCLGATAARTLLETEVSIGRLRGKFHDYRGATVLCTYHPSYLLRNPAAKRDVWEDMQMLMKRMGIELK